MIKSDRVNRIKFEIWMDKKDVETLDSFASEKGMTRSAASRYIIMDYLKDKAQYNIKEDPQVKELREAVISLNQVPVKKDVRMPDNADPVLAEGIRETLKENMEFLGLDPDEYKQFIDVAVIAGVEVMMEHDARGIQLLKNDYYEKANKR